MVIDSRNSSILPRRGALLKVNQVGGLAPDLCSPRQGQGTQNTHIFNTERVPLIAEAVLEGLARVAVHAGFLRWNHPLQPRLLPRHSAEREKVLGSPMVPLSSPRGKCDVAGCVLSKEHRRLRCDPVVCRAGRGGEPAAELREALVLCAQGLHSQGGSWKLA